MAQPVYSQRFIASHDGLNTDFVVPAGVRAILRDVTMFNASAVAPETAQLVLIDFSLTVLQVDVLPSSSSFWTGRLVLEPGETLHMVPNSFIDLTATGYLLNLP